MRRPVLVVRVDHMRRSGPYLRTLEAWTLQLGLATLVAVSRDRGIVIIAEGDRAQLTKLLLNWKTVNIDVDSRGKPCKERMILVVYREQKENQEKELIGLDWIEEQIKEKEKHFITEYSYSCFWNSFNI